MKRVIKKVVGRGAIAVAQRPPAARGLVKAVGVRTSQGCFGQRVVSIPLGGHRSLQLTDVDESYLAFQLFWHGGDYYEPITRLLLEQMIQKGDIFVDIGAHVGFFSLVVGQSAEGVKIVAFEPNPRNFQTLEANLKANSLKHVVCEPAAISDRDGSGILYLTDSDMSASLMKDFQAQDTKQVGEIEVRTRTVDSYFRTAGLKGRMILKVDIEGHEPAFFRGAMNTLAHYKPDIILEVLYDMDPTLVSDLKKLGYHFYPITDQGIIELDAPRLFKRFPFLFLNHLFSVRPKQQIADLFEGISEKVGRLNLLNTSKHFPPEVWPDLWRAEAQS